MSLLRIAIPLAALAGVWLLLSRGEPASWIVGAPFVAVATWAALRLHPGSGIHLSPSGVLRFLPFFLWQSLLGGLDVMRRVLGRRLRVAPGFAQYHIRLADPAARLLFANSVSLLPGTLAADLQDDCLSVHALDGAADFTGELERVEQAVGRVFGERL